MARNMPLLTINYFVTIVLILLPCLLMDVIPAKDVYNHGLSKREAEKESQKLNLARATETKPTDSDRSNGIPGATPKIVNNAKSTPAIARSTSSHNDTDKSVKNCTGSENCNSDESMVNYFLKKMSDNSDMLLRTMLVLLGVTSIVIVYFVVKAVRLRRRRSKSRKYGVITKGGENMEMEPLGDGNEDEDDYTVFEMNGRRN